MRHNKAYIDRQSGAVRVFRTTAEVEIEGHRRAPWLDDPAPFATPLDDPAPPADTRQPPAQPAEVTEGQNGSTTRYSGAVSSHTDPAAFLRALAGYFRRGGLDRRLRSVADFVDHLRNEVARLRADLRDGYSQRDRLREELDRLAAARRKDAELLDSLRADLDHAEAARDDYQRKWEAEQERAISADSHYEKLRDLLLDARAAARHHEHELATRADLLNRVVRATIGEGGMWHDAVDSLEDSGDGSA